MHEDYGYFVQDDAFEFVFEIWGLVLGFLVGYRADKCLHSYTSGQKLVLDMDYQLKTVWKIFCFHMNGKAFHQRSSLTTQLRREELSKDLCGFLVALMTLAFRDIHKGHLLDHESLPGDMEAIYFKQLEASLGKEKREAIAGPLGLFQERCGSTFLVLHFPFLPFLFRSNILPFFLPIFGPSVCPLFVLSLVLLHYCSSLLLGYLSTHRHCLHVDSLRLPKIMMVI
jgi:hypothetical protein